MADIVTGGLSADKPADEESQQIANQIKGEVEKRSGRSFAQFTVVKYKTQLVAGTNFFMKIQVADDDYIHVRVYRKLPCYGEELSLTSYQLDKKKEDPIEYFQD